MSSTTDSTTVTEHLANAIGRHSVLVGNSRSYCGNCSDNAMPSVTVSRCDGCGTTWVYAVSTHGINLEEIEMIRDQLSQSSSFGHLTYLGSGDGMAEADDFHLSVVF